MSNGKIGKLEATTTSLTSGTVKEIGSIDFAREIAVLSNETVADFYYAFGDRASTIADFSATNMLKLRADTDLYFTDNIPTGKLFVLQSSGGALNIKTRL